MNATGAQVAARRVVLLGALLGGVLGGRLALVVVGSLGSHLVGLALFRSVEAGNRSRLEVLRGELQLWSLLDQLLVVAFLARGSRLSGTAVGVLVLCVVGTQLLLAALVLLQLLDAQLRVRPVAARGFPSHPTAAPAPSGLPGRCGVLVITGAGLAVDLALLVALVGGGYGLVAPGALLMLLLAAGVVLASVPGLLRLVRAPRADTVAERSFTAVREHAPRVVLYMSNSARDMHCLRDWLGTLEDLGQPALIVLRVPETLALLPPTTTPAICVTSSRDLLRLGLLPGTVALFVANAPLNTELLRDAVLRSAFISHGDSDKAASANPVCKMYDEVWVAGEAGRQRYLEADVGVRAEAIRLVGRPQVRRVQPAPTPAPGAPYRVLYAPTWEGLYGDEFESSLVHSGRDVVGVLLATDGIEVVYRPHPKSGARDPAFGRAHADIVELLRAAGPQHRVEVPTAKDLYSSFNGVDALVADVSGVVSDFLASDKPYFVVNGRRLPDEVFRTTAPSAGGAYLVGPRAAGLAAGLADARGTDTLRARRRDVRTHLIGPPGVDPLGRFTEAITALAATRPWPSHS